MTIPLKSLPSEREVVGEVSGDGEVVGESAGDGESFATFLKFFLICMKQKPRATSLYTETIVFHLPSNIEQCIVK